MLESIGTTRSAPSLNFLVMKKAFFSSCILISIVVSVLWADEKMQIQPESIEELAGFYYCRAAIDNYKATSTLAGTRIRTDLSEPIEQIEREIVWDFGVTHHLEFLRDGSVKMKMPRYETYMNSYEGIFETTTIIDEFRGRFSLLEGKLHFISEDSKEFVFSVFKEGEIFVLVEENDVQKYLNNPRSSLLLNAYRKRES